MRCVYCELPEIKIRTVVENGLAWAFPTNIPITPGHMLVVPKRCVAKYEDLTADERSAIEDLRAKIVTALKKLFGAEGFNYAWNEGVMAGQAVPHFHLHIVPRKVGDEGIYEYDPRKFLYRPGSREKTPEEELDVIAEEIRSAIERL
jgi:diadenosine tetraphosphate (Ap4A) HIT family hydrolase